MFFDGKTYKVLRATPAIQAAWQRLLRHQAEMFLLLEAEATIESVTWLVDQLVPDFDSEVTEGNRKAILAGIKRAQNDPELARIVDTRDARRFEEGEAE